MANIICEDILNSKLCTEIIIHGIHHMERIAICV